MSKILKGFKEKILVVGDIILDYYAIGSISKFAQEAPVPVFLKNDEVYKLGGAGNVFYNIHALGINVDLMGAVGNDEYGNKILKLVRELNNEISYIYINNMKTTVKKRYLCKNGQEIFREDIESNNDCRNEQIVLNVFESIFEKYSLIVFSDYNKGFLTARLLSKMLKISKKHGIKTLVDPKENSFEKYRYSYLIKPNINEFCEMYGSKISMEDILSHSEKILDKFFLERLIITCDKEGVIFLKKNQKAIHIRNSSVLKNSNVVGAGDVFMAVFAVCLLYNIDEIDALKIANAVASVTIDGLYTCCISNDTINKIFLNEKIIKSTEQLKLIRTFCYNKKIVFTNGCFDMLHVGHLSLLKEAKQLGDILVVGINSDCSVKKLKGKNRPIISLEERIKQLSDFSVADLIVPFNEDTPIDIITNLKPDILVKGNEYFNKPLAGSDYVKNIGGQVVYLKMLPDISTTKIIKEEKNYD